MFNIVTKSKSKEQKDKVKFDKTYGKKFLLGLISKDKEEEVQEPIVETVYRADGVSVDKIIETDALTNQVIKITYYDYFDDKKIKSIEEFEDGLKIRLTLFSFFKSVSEFDKKTGKKIKTINYAVKDESKIMSKYDYDIETERISRMTVYRADGKNIAFIKELSPETGAVSRCINYKKDSSAISSVSKYELLGDTTVKTTYYYTNPIYMTSPEMVSKKITADNLNKKVIDSFSSKKVNYLIDNLYKNKNSFSSIQVS